MTDDELRALVEQAHQLDELTRHPGWLVLEDYILRGPAGFAGRQRAIINGLARDHEDYLKQTSWMQGADAVLKAPATVAEMVRTERERRAEAGEE